MVRHTFLTPLVAAMLLAAPLTLQMQSQQVVPLWPHSTPEPPQTTEAEADVTKPTDGLISGHRTARLANVTQPSITVYKAPSDRSTGTAALVFPGGGYQRLAWNGEGTDTCEWLNSLGMTCLLVKYRIPQAGHYPEFPAPLEDAQQAMRIAKKRASEWHVNPEKIGVVGFSAGGHHAVLLSTHWDDKHVESTPAAPDVDATISAKPAFAILGYPAYLESSTDNKVVDPTLTPVAGTPPTFIIQAENDKRYIFSALAYYRALMDAHVYAELHLYPTGGHGFGMHPVNTPEEHWTQLAAQWLRMIGEVPPADLKLNQAPGVGGMTIQNPCMPQPPTAGRPDARQQQQQQQQATNPQCW